MVLALVSLVVIAIGSHGGEIDLAARFREGGIDIRGPGLLISLAEIGVGDDPIEATQPLLIDELVEHGS